MGEVVPFKQRENEPEPELVFICDICEGQEFVLYADGLVECATCSSIVPAAWVFMPFDDQVPKPEG